MARPKEFYFYNKKNRNNIYIGKQFKWRGGKLVQVLKYAGGKPANIQNGCYYTTTKKEHQNIKFQNAQVKMHLNFILVLTERIEIESSYLNRRFFGIGGKKLVYFQVCNYT